MRHENSADQRPDQDFSKSSPDTYPIVAELYGLSPDTSAYSLSFSVGANPLRIMHQYENLYRGMQAERQLSRIDPLTELPNRRAWDEAMVAMDEGFFGDNPAVIVIDLDGFKGINDTAGHEMGDSVLKEVANTLSRYVRCSDKMFFRTGGDEYTGILPESEPDEHPEGRRGKIPQSDEERILSIRRHLEADLQPVFERYAGHNLGASIGVAIREPGMSADMVTHAADQDSARIKEQHKREEFFNRPPEEREEIRQAHLKLRSLGVTIDRRVYGHSFEEPGEDHDTPDAK